MEEVKKTRKKPAAKKDVQNTVDTATDKLELTTQPEAAAASQPNTEAVTEKPVKKKSTTKPAKSASSEKKAEPEAPKADEQENVEQSEAEVKETEQPAATEQEKAEEPKSDEQSASADEQATDDKAEAQDTDEQEPAKAEEKPTSAEQDKKPAKADGKKFVLSKKLIIILSCVLAAVIVAIVLAVTLTSCNSGSDNKYRGKTYTVTFDTMGGSEIASYTLHEGDKITEPATKPTKDMFIFDGWYIVNPNKPGEKQKFVFDTALSQDITLVAGWRGETSVKVEFDANGGAFADNKEVVLYGVIGSPMSAPEDAPARTGYKFSGWYEDKECYNKFDFGSFPINNATLYAGWAKDADFGYVSYYGNGELLRTDPVRKTDNVAIPDLFNDSNIVVGNWYTDAEMTDVYTAGKPTDDLKLYTTYYTKGLTFSRGVVTGYTGTATDVVVPTKYNGTIVSSIGADAFYRTSELPAITSVKLPDSIRSIGSGAFYNCQYLASINLTENVTTIGADAFYRNERLRTLGDITGLRSIGDNAFNGCKDLRDFEFGGSLMTIGDYAFNDCVLLTKVTLTGSVQSVGDNAFSGCTSLKTVVAESLVLEKIGSNAFQGCTSLTEITLEKTSDAVEFGGNPVTDSRNVTIYVPSALLEAYQENNNNAQFKDKFAAIR